MEKIEKIRKHIDELDLKIATLLDERENAVIKLGEEKKKSGLEITDEEREKEILKRLGKKSQREVFKKIIEISKNIQRGTFD